MVRIGPQEPPSSFPVDISVNVTIALVNRIQPQGVSATFVDRDPLRYYAAGDVGWTITQPDGGPVTLSVAIAGVFGSYFLPLSEDAGAPPASGVLQVPNGTVIPDSTTHLILRATNAFASRDVEVPFEDFVLPDTPTVRSVEDTDGLKGVSTVAVTVAWAVNKESRQGKSKR